MLVGHAVLELDEPPRRRRGAAVGEKIKNPIFK
jgi:hypothetical protein